MDAFDGIMAWIVVPLFRFFFFFEGVFAALELLDYYVLISDFTEFKAVVRQQLSEFLSVGFVVTPIRKLSRVGRSDAYLPQPSTELIWRREFLVRNTKKLIDLNQCRALQNLR